MLPFDVLYEVFRRLGFEDFSSLRLVSRRIFTVCEEETLCRKVILVRCRFPFHKCPLSDLMLNGGRVMENLQKKL